VALIPPKFQQLRVPFDIAPASSWSIFKGAIECALFRKTDQQCYLNEGQAALKRIPAGQLFAKAVQQ
jgi:hypothetical protein